MNEQTRKALELAREALEWPAEYGADAAIAAIDAALAPAAPVALKAGDTAWMRVRIDTDVQEGACFATPARHPSDIEKGFGEWDDESQVFGCVTAAPVAQPLAGLISRASMVLKPSAGHEVTFHFDDLEDATRMRLWAESRVAQVAAPAAPASQPVSDADIDALKWHLEADRKYEQYTGHEYLKVTGHREFARAVLALRPKVQPLTDEQIDAAISAWFTYNAEDVDDHRARMKKAIIASHSIGQGANDA